MGIKLQKYQQQTVTPSEFSGKEVSIQAAAAAPMQAAAAQQDMIQGVMGALQSREDYKQRQSIIAQKRAKAIADQYESDAADQATLAVAQYEAGRDATAPDVLGDLEKDEGIKAMNQARDAYLANVPEANRAAAKREFDFKIAQATIKAQGEGTNRLMSKGRTQTQSKVDGFINSMTDENRDMMVEQINTLLDSEQVQDYYASEPGKLTELRQSVLPGYETLQLRNKISEDPSEALRIASEQLSGKEVTYGSLSASDVKMLKSEALTALKKEQDELANNTWLSDDYNAKSDTEKMAVIDGLLSGGKISTSRALAEKRRIQEDPRLSPSEIAKLGEARADIQMAAAGRHPDGKTVQELVEEYGSGMNSQDYMSRLSSYALREVDPDVATGGRGYQAVRSEFEQRIDMMATDGNLIEAGSSLFGWSWSKEAKQFQGMDRDGRDRAAAVFNQAAKTEFANNLDDWRIKNPDATVAETREEAQNILQDVAAKFAQSNVPSLIEEYGMFETEETTSEGVQAAPVERTEATTVDPNESNIARVMERLNIDREAAIQKLKDNNRWN